MDQKRENEKKNKKKKYIYYTAKSTYIKTFSNPPSMNPDSAPQCEQRPENNQSIPLEPVMDCAFSSGIGHTHRKLMKDRERKERKPNRRGRKIVER